MPRSWKLTAFLLAVMLVAASCGGKQTQKETAQGQAEQKEESKGLKLLFPQVIERTEPSVGGTFVMGIVGDTPWKGIFNTFLYSDNPTYAAMLPMLGMFSKGGPNHEIVNGGYCDMSFDTEKKTATYHINPQLTWSDGVPV